MKFVEDKLGVLMTKKKPKIGVALSGGGNRGSYICGAMTAISEFHPEGFDLIAGTSIGGVVGASFAMGMPTRDQWEWWSSLSWGKVSNLRFPPGLAGILGDSFYSGVKMRNLFREIFPKWFSDLDTPLVLTACNLMAGLGEESNILISEGDLHQALLATVAIPGIFPPVKVDGKFLVDGGIGNYVPLEIFKDYDLIYAVLSGYGAPPEKPRSAIDIVARSFEMAIQDEIIRELNMFEDKSKLRVLICDRPEIVNCSLTQWLKGHEWLQAGYEDGVKAFGGRK